MTDSSARHEDVRECRKGATYERIVFPGGSRERFLSVHRGPNSLFNNHRVELAGISDLPPGYSVRRDNAQVNIALFCVEGDAWFESGGQHRSLDPGTVFLGGAGSCYAYGARTRWHIFWFHCAACSEWNVLFPETFSVRPAAWLEDLLGAVRGHLAESERHETDTLALCRAFELLLIGYLKRELSSTHAAVESVVRRRIEEAWGHVRTHPENSWSVPALAATCGKSPSHFGRLVRQFYGKAPMQIVRSIRMELALNLLTGTPMTIEQIALRTGYDNAFSLSKAFKKHFAQSPAAFRRT